MVFRCRHGPQGARLHARRISPVRLLVTEVLRSRAELCIDFLLLVILSYLSYTSYFSMHLIPMHLIQFWVPGYELSSDEDEPPLQPDEPADGGSALDDM